MCKNTSWCLTSIIPTSPSSWVCASFPTVNSLCWRWGDHWQCVLSLGWIYTNNGESKKVFSVHLDDLMLLFSCFPTSYCKYSTNAITMAFTTWHTTDVLHWLSLQRSFIGSWRALEGVQPFTIMNNYYLAAGAGSRLGSCLLDESVVALYS